MFAMQKIAKHNPLLTCIRSSIELSLGPNFIKLLNRKITERYFLLVSFMNLGPDLVAKHPASPDKDMILKGLLRFIHSRRCLFVLSQRKISRC